ncbi:MAG TPA: alpha-amylase family glycosyl hydrolase [Bacteroidota bacterium]
MKAVVLSILVLFLVVHAAAADTLDTYYSTKPLGSAVGGGRTVFRLFAPTAARVELATFAQPEESTGTDRPMRRDSCGVWEAAIDGEHPGLYYGYRVWHADDDTAALPPLCPDPYAKALASFTTYLGERRSIVVGETPFDWQGDRGIQRDWRDLVIYEMHIRDLTAHPSAGAAQAGTYRGLIEPSRTGGIDYIARLGANTVELLPAQEFAGIELPYRDSLAGWFNTWNPYERNHWGYMTVSFFAPAAYYAEPWREMAWNRWMGKDAAAITQFKEVVRAFHTKGIGVMMDVVYNHVSEFERANLKQIDSAYYFRLDSAGRYISQSGCGNDLKTERPMVRRMIVESVLYWMQEYHIDGFRFDLARLIDWETIDTIAARARRINPAVVLVAEPWGGGYDPAGFSRHGWAAWNDQIRNGVKGQNPADGLGWIFGRWQGDNSPDRIKSYVNGTLARDPRGLFQEAGHSVNYLESHDDNTFGDFARIGLGDVKPDRKISSPEGNARLTALQMKLNKLGALFLLTARGPVMIGEGQEFARSKLIAPDARVRDPRQGTLDANSYNKDNATNYLNFDDAAANAPLLRYYRGLIALRARHRVFRRAAYGDAAFLEIPGNPFALGISLRDGRTDYLVLMNADNGRTARFDLPQGRWTVLVNGEMAGTRPLGRAAKYLEVEPKTGYVLMRDR